MYHLTIDNCAANDGAPIKRTDFANRQVWGRAISSSDPISVLFDTYDGDIGRSTNTSSIFSNCIQHRLNIRRRASDDAQDLARCSLLLQRLLELIEQPYVLNGDHCLIGEGFKKLD